MKSFNYICLNLLICCSFGFAQVKCDIKAGEAKKHLGEELIVCGKVVQVYQPKYTKGNPIYLNFDRIYPNNPFTIVIWEDVYKEHFSAATVKYFFNKNLAVFGTIKEYKGKPQITIKDKTQIRIVTE